MTLFTRFFYRLVNILQAEVLFFILVAAKTEGYTIHGQKEFTLRGMRVMADNTITFSRRVMDNSPLAVLSFVMTIIA